MSIHIQKQFIDFFKNSEVGFIEIENLKVSYINRSACRVFKCDNSQKALIDIMSSDIVEKILKTRENRFKNIEINGTTCDVNAIFGDDELYIFIHIVTDNEKVQSDMEYKSRCILAITQYQKQILDNMATIFMGNDNAPELYELMVKNTYRRMYKSNGALTEISKSMFSRCDTKRCYNANAIIEKVLENVKNLFPNVNVKFEKGKKDIGVYCESESLQIALYSAISAFLYLDKKEGDFAIECTAKDDKVTITVVGKGVVWSADQRAFINRENPEKLLLDVHRFGYDMLRVANIMDWQGGTSYVRLRGNSTLVSLTLENEKTKTGELVMNSDYCEYLALDDVKVLFSDITEK